MVELSLIATLFLLADSAAAAPAQAPAPPPPPPAKLEAPPVEAGPAAPVPGGEATKQPASIEGVGVEGAKVPASQVEAAAKGGTFRREARFIEVVVPVRLVARNQMGRRFRLVEARFVLGGTEVARLTAKPGEEVDLNAPVMVVPLRRGEHALTATLVFQGRNVGPFSYLDNYRYRVETTYSFYVEQTHRQPIIELVAHEQGGMMVPLERRPTLEIYSAEGSGVTPMTGVTHGTRVTFAP